MVIFTLLPDLTALQISDNSTQLVIWISTQVILILSAIVMYYVYRKEKKLWHKKVSHLGY